MADAAVLDAPFLDGSLGGTIIIILYKHNCVLFVPCLPIPCPHSTFCCYFTFSFSLFLKRFHLQVTSCSTFHSLAYE